MDPATAHRRYLDLAKAVALSLVLWLPGATEAGRAAGYPALLIDNAGRDIHLERKPQTIVALNQIPLAQLAALGIRADGGLADPAFQALLAPFKNDAKPFANLLQPDFQPDYERIAASGADIVFGYGMSDAQAIGQFTTFFTSRDAPDLTTLEDNLRAMARAVDAEQKAERAIRDVRRRIDAYVKMSPKNRSVMLVHALGPKLFLVVTKVGLPCKVLSLMARCSDIALPGPAQWLVATTEMVLASDPDVIMLGASGPGGGQARLAALSDDPLWRELSAVKADRVRTFDGYQSLTGWGLPLIARLVDVVMPRVYPETFPEPLTEAQIASILGG